MILKVSRKWRRLAGVLYYGGFFLMFLSIPYMIVRASTADALVTKAWLSKQLFSVLLPGCILAGAGDRLKEHLYRCPRCKRMLFRRGGGFGQKPLRVCGGCGLKVTVSVE